MKTITEMPQINYAAIALLERRLADARSGRIVHVGLVTAAMSGEVNVENIGLPGVLVVGAAQLQRQMLEKMFPAGTIQDLPMRPSSVKLSS